MKININPLINYIDKNWEKILLFILVILIYKQCQGSEEVALMNSSLKKDVKTYILNAKNLVDKNNILEEEKTKYKKIVIELKEKVSDKENEITLLNKKIASKISDIRLMKSTEIAKYYVDRYKMPREVKRTNLGTTITDTVAKLNITELIKYDGVIDELKITKDVLSLEKNISIQKDSIILNSEKQNTNLVLAIKENEKAINSQNEIIDNTEKMFKKERNKKNAWKVITAGVIGVSGFFLLVK
jgi:hypothetical protein